VFRLFGFFCYYSFFFVFFVSLWFVLETSMRQLTTLTSAESARTLADYLLTLRIDTKLEQQPEGWAVWVRDEDHMSRARQELEEFTRNPADPRYQDAAQTAKSLRQRKRQEDDAYFRRQERFSRRMSGPIASQRWTVSLIVACILVSLLSKGGHDRQWVNALSISLYRITEEGTIDSPGLRLIQAGEVWRLVTPIFMHFGIWHLLFNMLMFYDLGSAIERRRGPFRYLALVLALAIISNLVQYFFGHPVLNGSEILWVRQPYFGGMSGVVYGLFGYLWMKARFQPEMGFFIQPRTVIYLVAWFFLCMTGIFGPIANGAHAGGLVAGMLIGVAPVLWRSLRSD
jgi:GlpG protein